MLLSVVCVLVVAQSSSEIPEGLMNNPVFCRKMLLHKLKHSLPVAHIDLVTICDTVTYAFLKNKTQYYFFRLNIELLVFKTGDTY